MDMRLWLGPNNGASYEHLLQSARFAEETGYAGFFLADHYAPFAGDGRPGPTDVWTTLAGLARETTTIRLGSLVTSVTFRHPGPLGIIVAQVDAMSGGRIDFGIGAGYFEREHLAYGMPFPGAGERIGRLEEALEIITGSWATPPDETYSFDGRYYQLIESPALPKPAQRPRPPIIVGGTGKKRTPALAARFADEFNLQTTRRHTPQNAEKWLTDQDLIDQIDRVRTAAEQAGRGADEIVFSMSAAIGVGRTEEVAAAALEPEHYGSQTFDGASFHGTPSFIVEELQRFAQMGITRVYVRAPLQVRSLADNFELLASDVLPLLAAGGR